MQALMEDNGKKKKLTGTLLPSGFFTLKIVKGQ